MCLLTKKKEPPRRHSIPSGSLWRRGEGAAERDEIVKGMRMIEHPSRLLISWPFHVCPVMLSYILKSDIKISSLLIMINVHTKNIWKIITKDVQNEIWKHSPIHSNPGSQAQSEFTHKMFICYVADKVLER